MKAIPFGVTGAWPFSVSVLIVSFILLSGCVGIPTKEFGAYRAAFDQARKASEQVLLEYAATREQADQIATEHRGAPQSARHLPFKAGGVAAATDAIDDVAIRLKAWEIVAQYNEAITLLAEGKPAEQVVGATEGLVTSLSNFPFDAVQEVAEKVTPLLGVLSTALTELQKQYDRKKAVDSLAQVAPVIRVQLIGRMIADAEDFYNVRYGVNDRNLIKTNGELRRAAGEFQKLARSYQADTRVDELVAEVNRELAAFPKFAPDARSLEITIKQPGQNALDAVSLAQLQDHRARVLALVEKGQKLDEELDSYRAMMKAYERMLIEVGTRLQDMVRAAEQAQTAPPPHTDLIASVIRVRQAYLVYQGKKQ